LIAGRQQFLRGYIRSYGRIINMTEKNISQALSDLGLSDETAGKAASSCHVTYPKSRNPQQHWLYQLVNFISCYRIGWFGGHVVEQSLTQ